MSARIPVLVGVPTEEEGCTGDCDVCRRLRHALLDALEQGGGTLDGAAIAELADLAEADLLEHYGSVDSCLVAAYDELSQELYELHVEAFDGPGDWQSRFLEGMRAALDRIDSTPGAERLFFADELIGHPRLRIRRAVAQQRIAQLVAEEVEHELDRDLPTVQVEFILGAVSRAAQSEAADGMEPARVTARVSETLRLLEPLAA